MTSLFKHHFHPLNVCCHLQHFAITVQFIFSLKLFLLFRGMDTDLKIAIFLVGKNEVGCKPV